MQIDFKADLLQGPGHIFHHFLTFGEPEGMRLHLDLGAGGDPRLVEQPTGLVGIVGHGLQAGVVTNGAGGNVPTDHFAGLNNLLHQRLAVDGVIHCPTRIRVVKGRAVVLGEQIEMIERRAAIDRDVGVTAQLGGQFATHIGDNIDFAGAQGGDPRRLFADRAVA